MKAFQLKIMIKNSKPPIWRRVVVPEEITFSQLSIIFNKVIGWGEVPVYDIIFPHLDICVVNDADQRGEKDSSLIYLEASATYIGAYMEEDDRFTYVCEPGDKWLHRVDVEKVLEDYEYSYPKVVKYAGVCPVKDEGDIYDLDRVNKELKEECFCSEERDEEQMRRQRIAQSVQMIEYWNQRIVSCTLETIFQDFEKKDILEIAAKKGVKGISGCSKKELVKKLAAYMLQPQVLETYFLCLQDGQIEEFERAAEHGGLYRSEKSAYLIDLYEASYIGMLADGRVRIPKEVLEKYQSISSEEFHARRKRMNFLLACLRVSGALYGIAPVNIVLKMVNQHPELVMTKEELEREINNIPAEYLDYIIVDDKIYHKELYPYDRGILQAQENKEYYIPSIAEINDFSIHGYFPNCSETIKFKRYLKNKQGASEDKAETAVRVIQRKICNNCELEEIAAVLKDLEIIAPEEWKRKELAKQIHTLCNETRMLLNRGFTPNEIRQRESKQRFPLRDSGSTNSAQKEQKKKVYPNDPCPCGSGKKYKNCCKNK